MLSLGAWVVVLAYLGVRGCGRLRTLGERVSVYARFAYVMTFLVRLLPAGVWSLRWIIRGLC